MAQRKRDEKTRQPENLSNESWSSDRATALSDEETFYSTTAPRVSSRRMMSGLTLLRAPGDSHDSFIVEAESDEDEENEEEEEFSGDDFGSDDPFMFLSSGLLGASVAGRETAVVSLTTMQSATCSNYRMKTWQSIR